MRLLMAYWQKLAKAVRGQRSRRATRWSRRTVLVAYGALAFVTAATGGVGIYKSGILGEIVGAAERRAIGWTGAWGLAINNVQVEGRERTSRDAILSALGLARGLPILAVDPTQAKHRLEAMPWIRSASIERRFPDSLYIRIVERQPLAFWQRQGKLVLIDREGMVIPSDRLDRFGDLIVLVGGDAPAAGAALLDILATEPDLASHVAAAVRVGGRRWNLRLDNGIDIALPEDDPASAWRRLAQIERSDGILERDLQMVDLRLPDRLVVRTTQDLRKAPAKKKSRQPEKPT